MGKTVRLISSTFLLIGFLFLLASTPMAFAGKHDRYKQAKKDGKNARSSHGTPRRHGPNKELVDLARQELARYNQMGASAFGSEIEVEIGATTIAQLKQLQIKLQSQVFQETFSELLEAIEQILQGNLSINNLELLEETLEEFLALPGADMSLLLQIQDAILGPTEDAASSVPAYDSFLDFPFLGSRI